MLYVGEEDEVDEEDEDELGEDEEVDEEDEEEDEEDEEDDDEDEVGLHTLQKENLEVWYYCFKWPNRTWPLNFGLGP